MKQTICTLLICLAALTSSTALAQKAVFRKYMAADGLSDNTVLCGLRDSFGFVWLGTNNGLNCFDGRQNTIYRNMVEDNVHPTLSLSERNKFDSNIITALFEHHTDIWFGGAFGLYVYHRTDNTFERFDRRTRYGVNISSTVQRIVQAPGGHIWIATLGQGLFIYDPATDQLTQDSRHGSFFSDVTTTDGNVFAAELQGNIVVYDSQGQYLLTYRIPDYVNDKSGIRLEHTDGRLYIGCDRGIYTINAADRSIRRLPLALPKAGARCLLPKGRDALLVGTEQGIYEMRLGDDDLRLMRFDNPDDRLGGLSDLTVNDLMWDRDSTLWVMTQSGGVCFMPSSNAHVSTTLLPTATGNGQSHIVNAFCETPDGNLWIGSDDGLYLYDHTTQAVTPVSLSPAAQEVNVLMPDGDDLWIGTRHNGIIVMDTHTRQTHSYQYSPERPYTVTSNDINCLLRTSQGDIYVGTSWSLCRFDRQTENFMWFAEIGSMTNVTSLCEDHRGCVWAATSSYGLFEQTNPRQGFRNHTYDRQRAGSLPSNHLTTVFCDHEGTIWVATNGSGLCRHLADADGTFEPFGTAGSLLQEQQIYFITEDPQNNLWVDIEDGMARIDARRDPKGTIYLRANNNLMREQKPRNAAVITRQGRLFAGRNNGFVNLSTNQNVDEQPQRPVYITAVTLPYQTDDNRAQQIEHPYLTGSSIELPYADNSFTLHFSSPSFTASSNVRFEYMLSGFDQTWARGTRNAEATYANVPPGKYEFLLREAGNEFPDSYARLSITILPPWYRTTLAYVVYALLIVAGVYLAVRHYSRRLRERYNRRMKEFQARQEKENFESKINFFINLVHEIRTPLSLMSLPLEAIEDISEKAEAKGGPFAPAPHGDSPATANASPANLHASLSNHIAAIRRNMNYLLGITNQLLDFQKAERGQVELDLQTVNVGELLTETYRQFEDAIQVQGKQMQLQLPDVPVTTMLDREKVLKVLMNLLGNAFKYAKSEIILRLEQDGDDEFTISVIDDGPGVPPQERDKIFDVYYQIAGDSTAKNLGTGLGLAYARMLAEAHGGNLTVEVPPGGGSDFRLSMKIKKAQDGANKAHEAYGAHEPYKPNEPNEPNEPITPNGPSHRILIVEDNEELLQMTSNALRPHYRILKAREGVEALDVLRHQDVDVIVSDVMMPRMDGIELTRHVKEDINYSHIPVILLTAKTSIEAKLMGMQSGADIYMEKPFSARQLQLQIESLLRMRQQFHERMRQIDGASTNLTESELGLNQQDLLFMQRLQKMVGENMRDEEFSIDVLAEQMNMSRSSFYRKIKALTDQTPIEYLKVQRLERAAQLLRQGLRITEVAEQVGFTSSSYFAKCFKSRFGMLPKDYQNS